MRGRLDVSRCVCEKIRDGCMILVAVKVTQFKIQQFCMTVRHKLHSQMSLKSVNAEKERACPPPRSISR